jgi:hypothetical protein
MGLSRDLTTASARLPVWPRHAADTGWQTAALTLAAAAIMLVKRLNPMWMLFVGGALGGLGLL